VGPPAQPPVQAGSPRAGCRGPCPGGAGISPEKETPQPPWAAWARAEDTRVFVPATTQLQVVASPPSRTTEPLVPLGHAGTLLHSSSRNMARPKATTQSLRQGWDFKKSFPQNFKWPGEKSKLEAKPVVIQAATRRSERPRRVTKPRPRCHTLHRLGPRDGNKARKTKPNQTRKPGH